MSTFPLPPCGDENCTAVDRQEMTQLKCSCARNNDGSVTTSLCPIHADSDPCETIASVTGKRRRGSIINGVCSNCGWSTCLRLAATRPLSKGRAGKGPAPTYEVRKMMTELRLYVSPARPRHDYVFEVTDRRTGETRTVSWVAPADESDGWVELTVTTNDNESHALTELNVRTPTHEIVHSTYPPILRRETGES